MSEHDFVPCARLGMFDLRTIIAIIKDPKTRKTFARIQYAEINDPLLVDLLGEWLDMLELYERLWPFSYSMINRRLGQVLQVFGLEGAWTASGLRAGKATAYWLRFGDFERLRKLGRWKCGATLEHYIQVAIATMAQRRLNADTRRQVANFAGAAEGLARRWLQQERERRRTLVPGKLRRLLPGAGNRNLTGYRQGRSAKKKEKGGQLWRARGRSAPVREDPERENWSDWSE